jgi:hypothetical protein
VGIENRTTTGGESLFSSGKTWRLLLKKPGTPGISSRRVLDCNEIEIMFLSVKDNLKNMSKVSPKRDFDLNQR